MNKLLHVILAYHLEYTASYPLHLRKANTQARLCELLYLQSVCEQLVHLCHLGRNREIDGTVANLDNQSTLDFWVDLGDDLESLALGNVVGLVDGLLEAAECSAVEGLWNVSYCSGQSFQLLQRPCLFIRVDVQQRW